MNQWSERKPQEWCTIPMDLRTSEGFLTMSNQFTIAVPSLGLRTVVSMFMVVVFPAPFGPRVFYTFFIS